MPSFYKEPLPKIELKKVNIKHSRFHTQKLIHYQILRVVLQIPTTRPKSPKLGRDKTKSVTNSTEAVVRSPRITGDLKNPSHGNTLRKSISKLHSNTTKAKPTKIKDADTLTVSAAENNVLDNLSIDPPEVEKNCIEIEPAKNVVNISDEPDEIIPEETSVGGQSSSYETCIL